MGKPKRQHWVPQFYLRHFATPETINSKEPKVWVFSKESGDPTHTSIKNVAQSRYLYSPKDATGQRDWTTEENLGDFESSMRQVWLQLANGPMIDLHGDLSVRKGLALFISLLHLRHPRRLLEIETLHSKFVALHDQAPKDSLGNPLVDVEINGIMRPLDTSDWERYKTANAEDKKRMFIDALRQNAIHLAQILMEKRWSIVFSEEPVFITSDAPVVVVNTQRQIFGLRTPDTVVSFPISPTRILLMDDRYSEPQGHYYPLTNKDPGPANFTTWGACDRFMISSRHTDYVCAEMLAWQNSDSFVH